MKHRLSTILAVVLLTAAGVQSAWAQKMTVNLTNGKTVVYRVSQVESVTFDEFASDHEFVDLELPSGTLWATCNVGANSPEEYGDFFVWGDPVPSKSADWATYKWLTDDYKLIKYTIDDGYTPSNWYNSEGVFVGDGKRDLDPEDDAATVNWGSDWKMPSVGQLNELIDENYTTSVWTTQNGINGLKVTSKANGKSIFLPAGGHVLYGGLFFGGEFGVYWTRSLASTSIQAKEMYFNEYDELNMGETDRCRPNSVRPVYAAEINPFLVTSIELNKTSLTLKVNRTVSLTAEVRPSYADNPEVVWESSNKSIAQVSGKGGVTAMAVGTCTITCRAADGSGVKAECQVTVSDAPDTKEYVDLGLPSGTLWATCNVGATYPEEYGDYFAWGETTSKADYTWETYRWMTPGQDDRKYINKYTFADEQTSYIWYNSEGIFVGDNKTELDPEDDAATANWGREWKMPTNDQFEELMDGEYTIIEKDVKLNGVLGFRVTSRINGNSIFFPSAGYMDETDLWDDGEDAEYWTSSLSDRYSEMAVYADIPNVSYCDRYYGYSVRPVYAETKTVLVTGIELDETMLTLNVEDTAQLEATVLPKYATNKTVVWESSNGSVAKVSTDGLVTAVGAGTCTITCRATDGSGVKAECQVTVEASDTKEWVDLGLLRLGRDSDEG